MPLVADRKVDVDLSAAVQAVQRGCASSTEYIIAAELPDTDEDTSNS